MEVSEIRAAEPASRRPAARHDVADVIALFDRVFAESEGTCLVRGEAEPIYLPRSATDPYDRVVFAHGFFASALHEVAHWCIAGHERRRLVDYGYWYKPDGRSAAEQREFESVEARPQALEWIFATAAGTRFHFSADNVSAAGSVTSESWIRFQEAVARQARTYVTHGLPRRAHTFASALANYYGRGEAWLDIEAYCI
jgi:elongation factor P hydroxylase